MNETAASPKGCGFLGNDEMGKQVELAYLRQVLTERMKVYRELRRTGQSKLAKTYYRENVKQLRMEACDK